jgi:hypothetical protein
MVGDDDVRIGARRQRRWSTYKRLFSAGCAAPMELEDALA